MSDTSLLWAFCQAANHARCDDWQEHRVKLDENLALIQSLLEIIPSAIAIGKATQSAAERGQTALIGEQPKKPVTVEDYRDESLPPAYVEWYSKVLDTLGTEVWHTYDKRVKRRVVDEKADCRAATIETYKPRRVEIYFDGEPDEWNDKR